MVQQLFNKCPRAIFGAVVFCAGASAMLGFAPFRYYFLIPVSLGVLLFTIYYVPHKVARYAYLWGLGFFIAHCYWVNTAINVFGGVPQYISIPLFLLLPTYLALYPMLAVWLTCQFQCSKEMQIVFILPMIWVIMEFIRERLLTGFGWGTLGYSQAVDSPLIGYASVGGILLVTYAVVLCTALLFFMLVGRGITRKILTIISIVLLVMVGQVLKSINFTDFNSNTTTIGLAQMNISATTKFDKVAIDAITNRLYKIIADYPKIDIIFFPETSLPITWERLPVSVKQTLIEYSKQYQTSLALGVFKEDRIKHDMYNAIIAINASTPKITDDHQLLFYAKQHLVPFGEYIPSPVVFQPLLTYISVAQGSLNQGPVNPAAIALKNQVIAFNICYEEGFGDELIQLAKHSTLIANATNMAWYGSSYAMDLQLQQAQARAIELGRYVVRATNTGYSAIIDNKGNIIDYLPRDQFGVLTGLIQGFTGQTPYMRIGGSFYWILCLLLLQLILFFYLRITTKVVR